MNIIKQGYFKVINHVRNESKWYISIIVGTIAVYGWAQTQFLTVASAEVSHNQLSSDIIAGDKRLAESIDELTDNQEETNKLLATLISKQALSTVKAEIRSTDSEIFQLTQSIKVNGSNEMVEKRLYQLKILKRELESKQQCIIQKNEICE